MHYGIRPDRPSDTLLTVTVAEHDGKTKLTLRLDVLESVVERSRAWQSGIKILDRLAAYLGKT
ncbi:MAG TPA: hypothetical protein VLK82_05215 [Candidatus Tectomicrobia bacterium]|nr:hypothetical protein [Candidatus Tectomicrobia bacterium]